MKKNHVLSDLYIYVILEQNHINFEFTMFEKFSQIEYMFNFRFVVGID